MNPNLKTIGDLPLVNANAVSPAEDRIMFWDASTALQRTKAITLQSLSQVLIAGTVTSVNSLTGNVVLTPNIIGAAAAAHNHSFSDIVGLQAALDGKQGANANLTQIAAVSPTSGHVLRRGILGWESGFITESDIPGTIARVDQVLFEIDSQIDSHANLTGTGSHIPTGGVTNAHVSTSAAIAWNKINKSGSSVSDIDGLQTALDARILSSEKGQPSGLATLDGTGKLTASQIPASVLGGLSYQGNWNAATNSPSIPAASSGNAGYYYIATNQIASGHGYANLPDIEFAAGDWVISNGTDWQKIDNTDQVNSVFGRNGIITAQIGDYNTDQVTEGSSNRYFTDARARGALSGVSPISFNGTNGQISIQQANGSQDGFLSSTDWTTFNSKQTALGFTPLNRSSNLSDLINVSSARSNLGLEAGATAATSDGLPEGSSNLYFTNARARNALSSGSGISYNPSTGVISTVGGSGIEITYDQSSKPSSPSNGQIWLQRSSNGHLIDLWQWDSTASRWLTYFSYNLHVRVTAGLNNNPAFWSLLGGASSTNYGIGSGSNNFPIMRGDGLNIVRTRGTFSNGTATADAVSYARIGWTIFDNGLSDSNVFEFINSQNYVSNATNSLRPIVQTTTFFNIFYTYAELLSGGTISEGNEPGFRLASKASPDNAISNGTALVVCSLDYKCYINP